MIYPEDSPEYREAGKRVQEATRKYYSDELEDDPDIFDLSEIPASAQKWFDEYIAGKVSFPIGEEEALIMVLAAFVAGSNEGIEMGRAFKVIRDHAESL